MTPAEFQFVSEFISENQKHLTRKEQAFVTLVTVGQCSPSAAAKRLGYKSPRSSAQQICRRQHVHNVLLAYVELSRELLKIIEAEEAAGK